MKNLKVKLFLWFVTLVFMCPAVLSGEDNIIQPKVGLPLFLKIITYDESFNAGSFERITIYVVYDRSNSLSYEDYLEVDEFFRVHPDINVDGIQVRVRGVQLKSIREINDQISDRDYNLLLVTNVNAKQVEAIAGFARGSRLHSYSLNADFVPMGITIGVQPDNQNGSIKVNLLSAKLEGSKYSARLLKMCEIIEE